MANAVIVQVPVDAMVCLAASVSAHLIADVTGWFPAGAVQAIIPLRLADTRDPADPVAGKKAPFEEIAVAVAGRPGIAADAAAVAVNVTVTEPDRTRLRHRVALRSGSTARLQPELRRRPDGGEPGRGRPRIGCALRRGVDGGPRPRRRHRLLRAGHGGADAADPRGRHPPDRRRQTRRRSPGCSRRRPRRSRRQRPGRHGERHRHRARCGRVRHRVAVQPAPDQPRRSLNFTAGQTVAGAVLAGLTTSTTVCVAASATAHLVVDVTAWFPTPATDPATHNPADDSRRRRAPPATRRVRC